MSPICTPHIFLSNVQKQSRIMILDVFFFLKGKGRAQNHIFSDGVYGSFFFLNFVIFRSESNLVRNFLSSFFYI